MSIRFTIVASIILVLGAGVYSCGSEDKKSEPDQRFMVNVAIPETFRLGEKTYPATQCLPVQIQAVQDMKSKKSVALSSPAVVAFVLLKSEPENLDVAYYEDGACSVKIDSTTIPAGDTNLGSKKVYLMSSGEGFASFNFKFGGRSWGGSTHSRFTFQK